MRSKRIAPEAGRLSGASGFQNGQSYGASLGTAACYCGVGARRAFTCITCLRFARYGSQVAARMAGRMV